MTPEDAADRTRALTVPCSYCHAMPGELCVRKGTTDTLVNPAAHLARLNDAGITHAPLDTRELRRG
ncbi:zinc finger domain-containing protein [Pseudonocardia sp.]|uniref:zinc finger domain-containing protein n=1 Tax=Pseudonocardia sp. TaxID=60912 RepID=UPI003D10180E